MMNTLRLGIPIIEFSIVFFATRSGLVPCVEYCLVLHKYGPKIMLIMYVCSLSICMLVFVVIIRLVGAFCKWDDLVRKEDKQKHKP
jgi:protein-S-isoprenylcysteine O-methyltransferase Ste14